ncbi:PLP-dependent aminotransferase family protein [Oceanospirillum beijerinckii]|uniref:aminotransferase-like domain-containing protein n=1 Tax=Oceanospirillum beijerinckii TaxID=64976 RepID=UPI0004101F57|nr:PLP-dependent aminotransferase family protein [Oceanospirillum beijerinckii]
MARARYKHLVDQFATDIRSGKLVPGTRLPTHRQLAAEQGIALVTASRVYAELEAMGLVSGETGRGTFVRQTELPAGHGIDQICTKEGMLDLNFNSPALPGQAELLRQGLRQLASSGDIEALLHYQPHAGRKHERAIVAHYLERRGLKVDGEQVLLVNGAQHGLACAVMSLLKHGDLVAVDALTYPGFKIVASAQSLQLTPVSIAWKVSSSAEKALGSTQPISTGTQNISAAVGPDLDALERLCQTRPVRAVYAMPTLQNPLGWVMTLAQRQRLIAIARQYNLIIIEDAAYAFLADSPPPPLAALAPDITVYISGLSKSVATGLRMGFIAAPSNWIAQLERTIRATIWNTPALVTALACQWVEDGTVDYLEMEKRRDAEQRQVIAKAVFKELVTIGHPSSYFIWLPLPEEVRSDQIVMALMMQNVSVSSAEPFAITEHIPHAIRLALGSIERDKLQDTLELVRQTIDTYAYGVV